MAAVITLNNGEKIALECTQQVGDQVLVHKIGNEYYVNGSKHVEVGDEVLVFKGVDGEYYAVSSNPYTSCVKVTDGFTRSTSYRGEVVNLGTFQFNWDGKGKVYLLESCSSGGVNASYADDKLKATTSKGSVEYTYGVSSGGVPPGPPLELTNILDIGLNNITIEVIDVYGYSISCTSLYVVQIV